VNGELVNLMGHMGCKLSSIVLHSSVLPITLLPLQRSNHPNDMNDWAESIDEGKAG